MTTELELIQRVIDAYESVSTRSIIINGDEFEVPRPDWAYQLRDELTEGDKLD